MNSKRNGNKVMKEYNTKWFWGIIGWGFIPLYILWSNEAEAHTWFITILIVALVSAYSAHWSVSASKESEYTQSISDLKKKAEITETTEVSNSNIQDEEVIFKSLGYSIFSNLKEKNLIFEGWRDKKLFEVALSSVPAAYTSIKTPLKKAGYCFAQGVKDISSITPLFEAGERRCLILSDDDTIAKEKQRDYQAAKGYGVWKRYSEVDSSITAITGEDFVADSAFKKGIDDLKIKYTLPDDPILSDPKGKIYTIRQWLSKHSVAKNDMETDIREIKDKVFENLKSSEITPIYYQYLTSVVKDLEKLK